MTFKEAYLARSCIAGTLRRRVLSTTVGTGKLHGRMCWATEKELFKDRWRSKSILYSSLSCFQLNAYLVDDFISILQFEQPPTTHQIIGSWPPKEKRKKGELPLTRDVETQIKFGDIGISEDSMHGSLGCQGRVMYLQFLIVSVKKGDIVKLGPAMVASSEFKPRKNGSYVFTMFKPEHCWSSYNHNMCSENGQKWTAVCIPHSLQLQLMGTLLRNFTKQSAASESVDETRRERMQELTHLAAYHAAG